MPPAKFTGKRPVIIDIHGGPEGQSRPYFLGRDNKIRRACNVECEDETQALPRAAELKHIHGIEVWQQARKIGEIPPAEMIP